MRNEGREAKLSFPYSFEEISKDTIILHINEVTGIGDDHRASIVESRQLKEIFLTGPRDMKALQHRGVEYQDKFMKL